MENDHRICPVCGEKSIGGCRCPLSDQTCSNGHHWYRCPIHGITLIGESDHSGNTMRCQCGNTEYGIKK